MAVKIYLTDSSFSVTNTVFYVCEQESHVQVFPIIFCSQNRSGFKKIITDSHNILHVNMECPDDRYPKLKICIAELILDRYGYITAPNVNVFCDLALIKMTVSRFVGTGSFLTLWRRNYFF